MSPFPFHPGKVFVFGSNLAGRHGAGAAREAYERYGARWGIGSGFSGMSYAIPTKDRNIQTIPLLHIKDYVEIFLLVAREYQQREFFITPIGTGLAGYSHEQIAPMFHHAPDNCELPVEWKGLLK